MGSRITLHETSTSEWRSSLRGDRPVWSVQIANRCDRQGSRHDHQGQKRKDRNCCPTDFGCHWIVAPEIAFQGRSRAGDGLGV